MSAHADESPPPPDVLVQMVLSINETLVVIRVELEISQDAADHVRTHGRGEGIVHLDHLLR